MANHKKTTVDATIMSVNDDGVNYQVSIMVEFGDMKQGFTVQTPLSSFDTVKQCEDWLSAWVGANKASFVSPNSDSLFVGISVKDK